MTSSWSWHPERRPAIDLTGRKFGLLTAIEQAPSLGHGARWRCRCECGAERIVSASDLKRGERASHQKCGGKT